MIDRFVTRQVKDALRLQAAVALIGPRQVGKTTLALQIGEPCNVESVGIRQTALDDVCEKAEVSVVLGVETLFLDQLPQALEARLRLGE